MQPISNIIPSETAGTLDGLFRERVRLSPYNVAYRSHDRTQNIWVDTTWQEMARLVSRWQEALRGEALEPGDRVALLLKNCKEWVAFEQAALGLGLVVVPLYTDDRPDNITYILDDAGVRVLLLQDVGQWNRLAPLKDEVEDVQRFVILNHSDKPLELMDDRLTWADDWLPPVSSQPLRERGGDPNKLATIVYTSGTTGRPKGVMLSHYNILSNAQAACELYGVLEEYIFLSFLPLSHTFERTCGYYLPMMGGCTVAYARSIQQLADDLLQIRPTILVAVPRIFERVYDRLQDQLQKKSIIARWLFKTTMKVGWRRFLAAQGRGRTHPSQLLWPLLDRLVAQKLRDRFGGRMILAVSGGAALAPPIARLFISMGINLVQGYGMTETSPVISANHPENNDPASVGHTLPGIKARIGENDELEVKTPGMMLGYWNNHQATSEIIGKDGWLRTGDKAHIENGYIHITGRIKDILILSNGEKIPPADMEAAITLDPLFEQALIIGEGKPYLGALLVLNAEHWVSLAKEQKLDPFDQSSLADRKLHSRLVSAVRQLLGDFPGYAKVRRVVPLLEPWTIENGLLTPTLKVKRPVVMEQYAERINAIYQT